MNYKLRFTKNALKDIELHKDSGDIKLLQKLEVLLKELREHPHYGTGKPERLKHNLEVIYSRRINKKHRLVYNIKNEIVTVLILSAHSHYGDK